MLMLLIIVTFAVLVIIYVVKTNEATDKSQPKTAGLYIHPKGLHGCNSLEDLINSILYDGIYPFFTGLTVEELRATLLRFDLPAQSFEDSLKLSQLTMGISSISLPRPPCQCVKEVTLRLSASSKVCSFSIRLTDENALKSALVLLWQRFGSPFSKSNEFIIWRDGFNIINLDLEANTINIINEMLFKERPAPVAPRNISPQIIKKDSIKAGDRFKTLLFMHTINEDGSRGEIVADTQYEITEVSETHITYKDEEGNEEKKDIKSFKEMSSNTRYFKWMS